MSKENIKQSPLSSIKKNINEENKLEEKEEKTQDSNLENNEENKQNNLEEENKKLKDTLMRTLAELDNTRRRAIEEQEKTAKYAISKFSEDLIPIMENFYLAFKSIKDDKIDNLEEAKNFLEGIKLTQNELKKVFEKNGLIRLFPIKEEFNPELHNAITQMETDEVEEGKIIDVLQAGYKIKDRLLRPALVVVSKKKE